MCHTQHPRPPWWTPCSTCQIFPRIFMLLLIQVLPPPCFSASWHSSSSPPNCNESETTQWHQCLVEICMTGAGAGEGAVAVSEVGSGAGVGAGAGALPCTCRSSSTIECPRLTLVVWNVILYYDFTPAQLLLFLNQLAIVISCTLPIILLSAPCNSCTS